MQAIVQFFVSGQLNIWSNPEGQACLRKLLEAIYSCPGIDHVYLVTDASRLFHFASPARTTILAVDYPPELKDSPLPWTASAQAARIVAEQGNIGPGPAVVINPRNIHLNTRLISQALARHQASGKKILASVVEPQDHPCQFLTPIQILDMGHVMLFEAQPGAGLDGFHPADTVITKPFVHYWETMPPGPGAHFYPSQDQGYTPSTHGMRSAEAQALAKQELVWIQTDTFTARLAYPLNLLRETWGRLVPPRRSLLGANLLRLPDDPLAVAIEGPEPGKLHLRVKTIAPCGLKATLNIACLGPQGYLPDQLIEVYKRPEDSTAEATLVNDGGCHGLLYSLLAQVDNGTADYDLPYTPAKDIWRQDQATGACINSLTEEEIVGRQFFPHIQEIDGSIIVADGQSLRSIREALEDVASIELFPLPGGLFLDDRLTLASFQAREAV